MEITIISANDLKKTSTFSCRLRPFITLTTTPPSSSNNTSHMYPTMVDHEGGVNPTWGDKFDLSKYIDANFFNNKNSCIYLQLYTDRVLLGPRFLGSLEIPAKDIADGFSHGGTNRQLSYKLRKKDRSWGHAIVNVVVKLESSIFQVRKRVETDVKGFPNMTFGRAAIGIPVKVLPGHGDQGSLTV